MKPLNTILLLVIIAGCIAVGYGLPHAPERVVELVFIEVPVERIVEVERLVEVVEEVEVIKEVLVYPEVNLRPFADKGELREWLRQDKTNELEYIYKRYDCDDFAVALSIAAAEDGYYLGIKGSLRHLQNFTIIDGKMYKVEPQTDEIIYWHKVD